MAIIGTNQDEKDPNAPAGTPAGGGAAQPNTAGAGGAGYVGGGTGQGSTTTSAAPTSSGSFTNLGNYLSANQGGAAQMTGTVKGVLDASGNEAKNAIKGYGTAGQEDAAAGTAKADPGFNAQVKAGYNPTTGVYTGPTAPTAKYTGQSDPTKVAGYGAAQTAYQGLADKLGAAGKGQDGVAGLLKGAYQQPSYTAGENNLDSFLAGGTTAGGDMLKGAQTQWGDQKKNLDYTTGSVQAFETAGQTNSDRVGKDQQAAIKAQQDQAKAWQPFVASDGGNVPTMGTTSSDAKYAPKAPTAPGGQNPGVGPNAFEIAYNAGKAAQKGIKDTSPGQINHDIDTGVGGSQGAQSAGSPITGLNPQTPGTPGAFKNLVDALSGGVPGAQHSVNTNLGNAHKTLKKPFG